MKFALAWAVAAGAIGSGFQHGYNTGVLNSPQAVMEEWTRKVLNNPSNFAVKMYWSSVVSAFCVGAMCGGALSGIMANRFGRKKSLLMNNFLVVLAVISMVLAKNTSNIYLLIVGRFIIGINTGLNTGLGPTYLYEIAPVSQRGAIGCIYQLVITTTILLAQVMSIDGLLGNMALWDYLYCVVIIPAIYQCFALWNATESPRYVLQKEKDTLSLLNTLRILYPEERVLRIAQQVWNDVEDGKNLQKVSIKKLFQIPRLRIPTMIILALMLSQQTSGIDVVVIYSAGLFEMKGYRKSTANAVSIGIGIVNMLATLFLVFVIDVFGRKPLLMIGFCGMIISTVGLYTLVFLISAYSVAMYLWVILVYIYVLFFSISAGPFPWVILPELFSTSARMTGISFTVCANWFFVNIVTVSYPPLLSAMGPLIFLVFIVFQVLSLVVIWIFVPETAKRPVEMITSLFDK
ncbi:solute carrier family 2, facilitated glucose transporter member 3-like isoform X2 [Rhodnius prolixus]